MDGNILTDNIVTQRVKPDGSGYTVVAGTTNVVSDIVDSAGYEGVRFITGFGTITSGAATSQKAQDSDDSGMSGGADIAGSKVTVLDTDDGKIVIVDIYRPAKRYLTMTTDRATQNSVIDFMVVEKYGSRKAPVTQDSSIVAAGVNVLSSPPQGTA